MRKRSCGKLISEAADNNSASGAAAIQAKGLKDISDIRANHDWRAATGGSLFFPGRKGILSACSHDFERKIGQSLRAPLGSALRERRFTLHNRRSRPFKVFCSGKRLNEGKRFTATWYI